MSLSASVGTQIPTNVVEVGNEISQNSINAIAASASPATGNPFITTTALNTGLSTKSPLASPTFTGTVTIPAGASISGYLTTSSASSTYQTQAGMSSYLTTSSASSTYQPIGSYLTDAPNNGSEYVRKNAAWAIASGGGGGVAWGGITGTVTAQTDLTSYVTGLGYITSAGLSVTNIDLTGNFNGYNMGSGFYTFKWTQSSNTLRLQDGAGSGISISDTAITFPNSSTLTKAPFPRGQVIGTSITLAAGDENKLICITGSMNMINVPPDSSVNFAVGTEFVIVTENNLGVNYVNQGSSGSPMINGSSGSYAIPRYVTRLVKVAADTWYID